MTHSPGAGIVVHILRLCGFHFAHPHTNGFIISFPVQCGTDDQMCTAFGTIETELFSARRFHWDGVRFVSVIQCKLHGINILARPFQLHPGGDEAL